MTERLRKIDELTEDDHFHITKDSGCFYFLEYPSGDNAVNMQNPVYSFIHNFKKKMNRRDMPDWHYKARAISRTVEIFHNHFERTGSISKYTLIPIPPSKIRTDPMYDDRMEQVLSGLTHKNRRYDCRNILMCKRNVTASHESGSRPSKDQIRDNYIVDTEMLIGASNNIVLVDDVLTTGAHFCAAKEVLIKHMHFARIRGLFIARRILPDPRYDFDVDYQ